MKNLQAIAARGGSSMSDLPMGWISTCIDSLIVNISNGISLKQNKDGIGLPVSRIETIAFEEIDMGRVGYVDSITRAEAEKFKLENGDILFSHINSDPHLGKVAIYINYLGELYHGTNLLRIQLDSMICNPVFFKFACQKMRKQGVFSLIAQHAVNQSSINQKKIKSLAFNLPPLPEQHRIVAKLDSLLARSRSAREELGRVPELCARYRQAVLAAAFRGDLTADWREERSRCHNWEITTVGELIDGIEAGINVKCEERPPPG